MKNKNKIILDLCGGTGSWSKPYKDAGYDVRVVTLPKYDILDVFRETMSPEMAEILNLAKNGQVYGVLAAPPCTMFSMARTTAKTPRDLKGAMMVVQACLKIIWECQCSDNRLKFWAMENPKARLRWFMGIPALAFNPYDYGDPHRKPTDIWGNFNIKLRKKPVALDEKQRNQSHLNTRELPAIPKDYVRDPEMTSRAIARSITPQGFAKAFFNANR